MIAQLGHLDAGAYQCFRSLQDLLSRSLHPHVPSNYSANFHNVLRKSEQKIILQIVYIMWIVASFQLDRLVLA